METTITQVFLPSRMLWAEPILEKESNISIVKDINELQSNIPTVVLDLVQSNSSCSVEEIIEYSALFDKVILINCETPLNILDMAQQFDLANVHLIHIGKLNYSPTLMNISNIETFFGEIRKLYHRTQYQDLVKLTPFATKPLMFDALLGMRKLHRDFVYNKIIETCQDSVFLNYQQTPKSLSEANFVWPDGAVVIEQTNQQKWYSGNSIQYRDMITSASNIVPIDIYNQTCYSIVTETYITPDFVFLSEKTAKPLISKRLFVMFAGPGYLAHLRSLGFRTFDSVIDEGYDLELDDQSRWSRAFEQVQYLCSLPQQQILDKIQPIVEHNYNLFVSQDWMEQFEQKIICSITKF